MNASCDGDCQECDDWNNCTVRTKDWEDDDWEDEDWEEWKAWIDKDKEIPCDEEQEDDEYNEYFIDSMYD